jgi:hypothetical protein
MNARNEARAIVVLYFVGVFLAIPVAVCCLVWHLFGG